jgi:hypothetical protein
VLRTHTLGDLTNAYASQIDFMHACRVALCTQAGCLPQVYISTGGRYRLLRSYYRSEGD